MFEVQVSSMSPDRFRTVLAPERWAAFERAIEEGRRLLSGRVVWNVNSTARGGGVAELLSSLDVAIVHDPQPAGLVAALRDAGAVVIWRCHVGLDHPNDLAREAWRFLLPYVSPADVYVFSRESFAWEGLASERIAVIPPTIDVFSPKNRELDPDSVVGVLHAAAVIAVKRDADAGPAAYVRHDETPSRVDRCAELFGTGAVPADVPVVLQVSRWDTLKDPPGVIRGICRARPGEDRRAPRLCRTGRVGCRR